MSDTDDDYGAELYEALKRVGLGSLVTNRFKYEGVQRLKAADRAETARLFHGSSYALIQRIKTGTPNDVATMLMLEATARAHSSAILFAGLAFFP